MAGNERGGLLQRHLLLCHALRDSRPSKGDCQVLAVIAEHSGQEGESWPGVNRIANRAGIHRTTVMRSVDRLEAWGYVEVTRERGKSNLYRIASTSSVTATSTSSADATSETGGPVASTHSTSSASATTPVAPVLPDQSHPRYPNSAFELDSPNSEKRTQLPAAPLDGWIEATAKQEEQKRLQREERKAQERESIRTEYLQFRESHPDYARRMERSWPQHLADLIQDKAA